MKTGQGEKVTILRNNNICEHQVLWSDCTFVQSDQSSWCSTAMHIFPEKKHKKEMYIILCTFGKAIEMYIFPRLCLKFTTFQLYLSLL